MTDWELERLKERKLNQMTAEQANRAKSANVKVIIYSTGTCPYCNLAKEYLASLGIKYLDINVQADPDKLNEMARKSGQASVPVLDINGQIVVGFDRPAINEALAAAGAQKN